MEGFRNMIEIRANNNRSNNKTFIDCTEKYKNVDNILIFIEMRIMRNSINISISILSYKICSMFSVSRFHIRNSLTIIMIFNNNKVKLNFIKSRFPVSINFRTVLTKIITPTGKKIKNRSFISQSVTCLLAEFICFSNC